jgi:hypothetical protein
MIGVGIVGLQVGARARFMRYRKGVKAWLLQFKTVCFTVKFW